MNLLSTGQSIKKAVELSRAHRAEKTEKPLVTAVFSELRQRTLTKANTLQKLPHLVKRRLPVVIIYKSSTFSTPPNSVVFSPQSNQEIVDTIIQSFKIAEKKKVLLPAILYIDNSLEEMVDTPSQKSIDKYLSKFNIPLKLNTRKPGIIRSTYQPAQLRMALKNAKKYIKKASNRWDKKFHRGAGLLEKYNQNKKTVLVVYGSNSMTIKSLAKEHDFGVIRLKTLSPFPGKELSPLLEDKKIGVINKTTSTLYTKIKSITSSFTSSFITDKLLKQEEIVDIVRTLEKQETEQITYIKE